MKTEIIQAIDGVTTDANPPREGDIITLYRFKDICDHWAAIGMDAARLKALDDGGRYSQEVDLEIIDKNLYATTTSRDIVVRILEAGFGVRQIKLDPFDFTDPPKPVPVREGSPSKNELAEAL